MTSFDELVDKYYDSVPEDELRKDLELFLTTKLDMIEEFYVWLLGAVVSMAVLLTSLHLVIAGLGDHVGAIFTVLGLILVLFLFYTQAPLFKEMGVKPPLITRSYCSSITWPPRRGWLKSRSSQGLVDLTD